MAGLCLPLGRTAGELGLRRVVPLGSHLIRSSNLLQVTSLRFLKVNRV